MRKRLAGRIGSVLLILILCMAGCTINLSDSDDNFKDLTGLTMTMLDVGQGLSIFISADGYNVLYDGGGKDSSSYVVAWLKKQGIEKIDCMISSHYDEDHIAGLLGVMNVFQVEEIFCSDYEPDTKWKKSLKQYAADLEIPLLTVSEGQEYKIGYMELTLLAAANPELTEENNQSLMIRMTYGNTSFLLTGDAEDAEEKKVLSSGRTLKSDLLVAGHHGSSYSNGKDFVKAVKPDYVFISCGENNQYGFPKKSVLNTFESLGCEIFRTDTQGEVTAYSDGRRLFVSANPKEVSKNFSDAEILPEEESEYVINKNSNKFHRPGCSSVEAMSESNKIYTTQSRQELLDAGYETCGNCRP